MEIVNITSGFTAANSYLLIDKETNNAALVDPGGDARQIISKIDEYGVCITAILLTHGHFDHILALDKVKEYTNAKVYIHTLDNICLGNVNFSLMSHIGRDDTFDDADVMLEDGDEIKIGNSTISVMHTPGHTAGSVCFITDAGIISGDTLFLESIGRTDFPGGDFDTIDESIHRLYSIEGDAKVYPGHGGVTTLSHERLYNPFVKE